MKKTGRIDLGPVISSSCCGEEGENKKDGVSHATRKKAVKRKPAGAGLMKSKERVAGIGKRKNENETTSVDRREREWKLSKGLRPRILYGINSWQM
jgi:hypothetical protein